METQSENESERVALAQEAYQTLSELADYIWKTPRLLETEYKNERQKLVPRHSDYDRLVLRRYEGRQGVLIDEYLNGSRGAGSSRDEAGLLELQHHLMDCGRRDFEEPYYIGFGRGAPIH